MAAGDGGRFRQEIQRLDWQPKAGWLAAKDADDIARGGRAPSSGLMGRPSGRLISQ